MSDSLPPKSSKEKAVDYAAVRRDAIRHNSEIDAESAKSDARYGRELLALKKKIERQKVSPDVEDDEELQKYLRGLEGIPLDIEGLKTHSKYSIAVEISDLMLRYGVSEKVEDYDAYVKNILALLSTVEKSMNARLLPTLVGLPLYKQQSLIADYVKHNFSMPFVENKDNKYYSPDDIYSNIADASFIAGKWVWGHATDSGEWIVDKAKKTPGFVGKWMLDGGKYLIVKLPIVIAEYLGVSEEYSAPVSGAVTGALSGGKMAGVPGFFGGAVLGAASSLYFNDRFYGDEGGSDEEDEDDSSDSEDDEDRDESGSEDDEDRDESGSEDDEDREPPETESALPESFNEISLEKFFILNIKTYRLAYEKSAVKSNATISDTQKKNINKLVKSVRKEYEKKLLPEIKDKARVDQKNAIDDFVENNFSDILNRNKDGVYSSNLNWKDEAGKKFNEGLKIGRNFDFRALLDDAEPFTVDTMSKYSESVLEDTYVEYLSENPGAINDDQKKEIIKLKKTVSAKIKFEFDKLKLKSHAYQVNFINNYVEKYFEDVLDDNESKKYSSALTVTEKIDKKIEEIKKIKGFKEIPGYDTAKNVFKYIKETAENLTGIGVKNVSLESFSGKLQLKHKAFMTLFQDTNFSIVLTGDKRFRFVPDELTLRDSLYGNRHAAGLYDYYFKGLEKSLHKSINTRAFNAIRYTELIKKELNSGKKSKLINDKLENDKRIKELITQLELVEYLINLIKEKKFAELLKYVEREKVKKTKK